MSSTFRRSPAIVAVIIGCCAASFAAWAGPVNINSADAATLARELKGIGLKRAQAIVEYRTKHGPFKSPDELGLVRGIGPKVIQGNRADIRVEAARSPAPVAAPARTGAITR